MKYKLVTPITTEPISLAEVKQHLRLDSGYLADNIAINQTLIPASRAANSYNGTGVDILGKVAVVNLNAGTNQATGTVTVKIQESDDNNTFTDWTGGAFTVVTTANDNAVQEKQYTGSKRYIRVNAVVANAACEFSVDVVTHTGETSEDTLLSMWISMAREYGEDFTGHAFAPQTIDYYLDEFPADDYIEWPFGPLTSITSIKYKNSSASETTATDNTDYITDLTTFPGKIFLPFSKSWPSFEEYPYNAVTIRGVCGYTGTAPYIMPYQYKQAMLMHIGYLYKYRDQEIPAECMKTVDRLYTMRRVIAI